MPKAVYIDDNDYYTSYNEFDSDSSFIYPDTPRRHFGVLVGLPDQELQCSDWSSQPLSEEQIQYAAADAFYLLQIFLIYQQYILNEGKCGPSVSEVDEDHSNMIQSILSYFGDEIVLKESDKVPKNTKKKVKQRQCTYWVLNMVMLLI